ncbi:nicotinate-nucleotide adenylyltransferase [Olleya sp. HaHaR_3_96]|uniref:nicotinate-nucleotide adenylyltransferase n=1 Tax=Olleya sp. HaHaR_3_96 TaxID=2745560 RepID=UPI001C4F7B50|nr:nicotinate-nucleotide adenylyltransferase [Olleya sp. HaHaR_3_96]QXP58353.1 nicotinate-nucleotide adenylyltransferase [Olleya sp. HaHaR_3_96]
MKKVMIGLFVFGLTIQMYGQDPTPIELDEVVLVNNYKYLSSTDAADMPIEADQLQISAANFDVKTLDIYADEYEFYDVYFIIPQGKILATYDSDGKILRTAEKYKDVDLPAPILFSIIKRFPKWGIEKDVYLVNYTEDKIAKKKYKITLTNGDKRIKVKLDGDGNFL